MTPATKWEQVREEWSKAEQMGVQSVLQAAKVGQMLIELKAETPYREFHARVSEIGIQQQHSSRLMTLARHLPLLQQHKPDSQRAALALIKAQQPPKPKAIPAPVPAPAPAPVPEVPPREEEMKKGGYVAIAQQHGLIDASTGAAARAKVRDRIEELAPGAIEAKDSARIAEACRVIVVERNPEKAKQESDDLKNQLPESWQKKFDKALAARIAVEVADMQRQFEEQLREAKEQLAVKLEEAEAERAAAFQYRLGVDSHMTMDEFKLVRSCLHPDRAPEEQRDKFNRAFQIFNRLEKTVNTKAPISILRRHGWEKVSPYYKANS